MPPSNGLTSQRVRKTYVISMNTYRRYITVCVSNTVIIDNVIGSREKFRFGRVSASFTESYWLE